MEAKEFLIKKGISDRDFMDSGVVDLIERLLNEFYDFDQLKELFSKLSKEQRMEITADYCNCCGANEKVFGKCYCSPAYDE